MDKQTSFGSSLCRLSARRCSKLQTQSCWTRISARKRKRKKKRCQPYKEQTSYPVAGTLYGWVRGLCGAPDVPHAGHESQVSFVTEGNGVGVLKAPPVNVEGFLADRSALVASSASSSVASSVGSVSSTSSHGSLVDNITSGIANLPTPSKEVGLLRLNEREDGAVNLCFKVTPVPGIEVIWETILVDGKRLYVEVPPGILPEGSRESLITLLEHAEERLKCTHVILCFKKNRPDRTSLLRVFNFFGFSILAPGHPLAPKTEDLIFMAYVIDNSDDESSSDDDDDISSE